MRSRSRHFSLLSVTLLVLAALAFGQSATTSLRGTVYDPKGAVVAGASITLIDPAKGFTRTTKSDAQGGYQFLDLPPATYELAVNASGFAAVRETGIQLLVNTPGSVNVNMQVAGGTVTVEVAGTAPLVNTQDATLGHAFGADQIANLPFEGRDPTGILSLQPGVVFTGNSPHISTGADSRSGSVNGARSDQTNVTLDGVDNNDQLLGTAFQGAVRVPLDSLEEFKVTTSSSDADTGRSSGGQVSLITKSGTNKIHGAAYEYNRTNLGNANDWFIKASQLQAGEANRPPKLIRNTFGANVGGPIIKDRMFYFLAYEGQRKHEDLPATRVVPSANLRNGIISYPCDQTDTAFCTTSNPNVQIVPGPGGSLIATLTRAQVAQMDPNCLGLGTCTAPGANPAVLQLWNNGTGSFGGYPLPNTDTVGDGFDYRGFTFASPLPVKLNAYVAKLDYNLTSSGNHRLFVRGALNNDSEAERTLGTITGDGGSEFPGQPSGETRRTNSKSLTAGYTATLSGTLINNFRFGYIRQGIDIAGLQNAPYVHFRGMDDLIAETPTTNTNVPVWNVVDDVTKVKGSHNFQFGGNFRQVDNERVSNSGSFFYASTNVYWTNNSGISNTGSSLDPAAFGLNASTTGNPNYGFPAVDPNFGASYDFAMAAMAGLVTEVNSNYELDKQLNALPQGTLVPRHFRAHEVEFYGQDQWRLRPNLTLTYGLRYTLLQPPYETTGTQVAPSISLHDWFLQRGQAAYNGGVYDPIVQFSLSGQANGKQPYWAWDRKDIAPRFALAYSPNSDNGFFRKLIGGPGKTSIRAGYGLYFDHFGEGITNTFDRNGSFGLATSISNAAGIQSVDGSARFTGLNTIPTTSQSPTGTCAANCPIVEAAPSGSFPVTPPLGISNGGFAITWGLDDKLKTPYSHVVDFSVTRELPKGFVLEASYVGRFAHRLLQEEDLAEPTNLRDTVGGQTYFQAAQALAKQYYAGADISTITPGLVGSYWQNLFPTAAGPASSQIFGCASNSTGITNVTATQAMYDLFACFQGNETLALQYADVPGSVSGNPGCFPACATINGKLTQGNAYYSPQFSSLFAWRSVGNSAYNAAQFSLRHRSNGLSFDLNYTYSKSIDVGSNAERINEFEGFGFGSQIINSWLPNQMRAVSDFDTTHNINANWVYDLPVGRGKRFGAGMGRISNAVFGGWTLSGLTRWSSGYPFSLFSPAWSTNFQLQSPAVPLSNARPKTGSFIVPQASGGTGPNVFQDPGITNAGPNSAINLFRPAYPGEAGLRNGLRGPGTFNIDTAILKAWQITESQSIKFSWEMFNITNSPRFDVGTMSLNGNNSLSSVTSFGNFSSTLSQPRVMEFALRYIF